MLKPGIRSGKMDVWDDTKIEAGANWKEEIEKALASSNVAVLLVSANFLASDFIATEELPPLLKAAAEEGVKILWVYLNYCQYEYTALKDFQAALDISKPLTALTNAEQEEALCKICDQIFAAFKG
jgi:hypothetical protein